MPKRFTDLDTALILARHDWVTFATQGQHR